MLNATRTETLLQLLDQSKGTEGYVFGSHVQSSDPGDLDLLIVYDPAAVSIARALELRKQIARAVRRAHVVPHIVLLDRCEEAEVRFIESAGAVPLRSLVQ